MENSNLMRRNSVSIPFSSVHIAFFRTVIMEFVDTEHCVKWGNNEDSRCTV